MIILLLVELILRDDWKRAIYHQFEPEVLPSQVRILKMVLLLGMGFYLGSLTSSYPWIRITLFGVLMVSILFLMGTFFYEWRYLVETDETR